MTHPEDTATIERDLRAVDAALAGSGPDHEDPAVRELQELALALRADSASPDPGFSGVLRDRMDAGFPRRPASARARQEATLGRLAARATRSPRRLPSWLLPAAGTLATVALVALAIAGLDGPADQDGGGGGRAADAAAGRGGGAAETSALAPASPDAGFAPLRRQRKIERSVSMTLSAPDDEVAEVADGVTDVADRHGGFVLRSDLSTGENGASGSFELRIPSARLRPALRDLAGLATVRSQSQSGQDVTREHVTRRDRLQAARAERRSLLRRLEKAATDEEAEAIRRRLDLVAGEINGLRAQLRDLRLRTDYAIVNVELAGGDGNSDGGGGASSSLDDAVGDAGELLVVTAGVLIRALAVALPLALAALATWIAARGLRRRRRESALA